MKAINITQIIKNLNPDLFTGFDVQSIRVFGELPKSFTSAIYNIGQRTDGYQLLDNSIHEQDGFFDLIQPEISENQQWGGVYFDADNRVFTHYVEEKRIQIPATISQRQLRTQLTLNGFDLNNVQDAINALSEPNKTIAQIAWDYALTFVRSDTLLISLAEMLGISDEELDDIFINASKL